MVVVLNAYNSISWNIHIGNGADVRGGLTHIAWTSYHRGNGHLHLYHQ